MPVASAIWSTATVIAAAAAASFRAGARRREAEVLAFERKRASEAERARVMRETARVHAQPGADATASRADAMCGPRLAYDPEVVALAAARPGAPSRLMQRAAKLAIAHASLMAVAANLLQSSTRVGNLTLVEFGGARALGHG